MRYAPLVPRPKPSDTDKRKPPLRPFTRSDASSASLQPPWMPATIDPYPSAPAVWNHELPAGVMAKLEVGDVNDPLEREADAVADLVMRMPAPSRGASDGLAPETDAALDDDSASMELSDAPMAGAFGGAGSLPAGPGFVAHRTCASCESEGQEDEIYRSRADALVAGECDTCEDETEIRRACWSCDAKEDTPIRRSPAAGSRRFGGGLGGELWGPAPMLKVNEGSPFFGNFLRERGAPTPERAFAYDRHRAFVEASVCDDRPRYAALEWLLSGTYQTSADESEIRRACAGCDVVGDDEIHREAAGGWRGGPTSAEFAAQLRSRVRSGGRPLPDSARNFLEPRLGVGLGHLRMHDDEAADSLAKQINARAFTLGTNIFFGSGELKPSTHTGMRLIAHETAHVLQNASENRRSVKRSPLGLGDLLEPPQEENVPDEEELHLKDLQSMTNEVLQAADHNQLRTLRKYIEDRLATETDNLVIDECARILHQINKILPGPDTVQDVFAAYGDPEEPGALPSPLATIELDPDYDSFREPHELVSEPEYDHPFSTEGTFHLIDYVIFYMRQGHGPFLPKEWLDDPSLLVNVQEELREHYMIGEDRSHAEKLLDYIDKRLNRIDERRGDRNVSNEERAIAEASRLYALGGQIANAQLHESDRDILLRVREELLRPEVNEGNQYRTAFVEKVLDPEIERLSLSDAVQNQGKYISDTARSAVTETRRYLSTRARRYVASPPMPTLITAGYHGLTWMELGTIVEYLEFDLNKQGHLLSQQKREDVTESIIELRNLRADMLALRNLEDLDENNLLGRTMAPDKRGVSIDGKIVNARARLRAMAAQRIGISSESNPVVADLNKAFRDAWNSYAEFKAAYEEAIGVPINDGEVNATPAPLAPGALPAAPDFSPDLQQNIEVAHELYGAVDRARQRAKYTEDSGGRKRLLEKSNETLVLLQDVLRHELVSDARRLSDISTAIDQRETRIAEAFEKLKEIAAEGSGHPGALDPGTKAYAFRMLRSALERDKDASEHDRWVKELVPDLNSAAEYDRVFNLLLEWNYDDYLVIMARGAMVRALQDQGVVGLTHHAVGATLRNTVKTAYRDQNLSTDRVDVSLVDWAKVAKGFGSGVEDTISREFDAILDLAQQVNEFIYNPEVRAAVKDALVSLITNTEDKVAMLTTALGTSIGNYAADLRNAGPWKFGYRLGEGVVYAVLSGALILLSGGMAVIGKAGAAGARLLQTMNRWTSRVARKMDGPIAKVARQATARLRWRSKPFRQAFAAVKAPLRRMSKHLGRARKVVSEAIDGIKPKLRRDAKLRMLHAKLRDLDLEIAKKQREIYKLEMEIDELGIKPGTQNQIAALEQDIVEIRLRIDDLLIGAARTRYYTPDVHPAMATQTSGTPTARHHASPKMDRAPDESWHGRKLSKDELAVRERILAEIDVSDGEMQSYEHLDVIILDDLDQTRLADDAIALTTFDFGKPTVYVRKSAVDGDYVAEEAAHIIQRHAKATERMAMRFEERFFDRDDISAEELLSLHKDHAILELDAKTREIGQIERRLQDVKDGEAREELLLLLEHLRDERRQQWELLQKLDGIDPRYSDTYIRQSIVKVAGDDAPALNAKLKSVNYLIANWAYINKIDAEDFKQEALNLQFILGVKIDDKTLKRIVNTLTKEIKTPTDFTREIQKLKWLASELNHLDLGENAWRMLLDISVCEDGAAIARYLNDLETIVLRLGEAAGSDELAVWRTLLSAVAERGDGRVALAASTATIAGIPHHDAATLKGFAEKWKGATLKTHAAQRLTDSYSKLVLLVDGLKDSPQGTAREQIFAPFAQMVKSGRAKDAEAYVGLVGSLEGDDNMQLRTAIVAYIGKNAGGASHSRLRSLQNALKQLPSGKIRLAVWRSAASSDSPYANMEAIAGLHSSTKANDGPIKKLEERIVEAAKRKNVADDLNRAARRAAEDDGELEIVAERLEANEKVLAPVKGQSFEEQLKRYVKDWNNKNTRSEKVLSDSWNAKTGKRKGVAETIDYTPIYSVLGTLQTTDDVRAVIWSWRRLIAYIAHQRNGTKLVDYEKLIVTEILAGADLNAADPKALKNWSDEFRARVRAVFLKDALAKKVETGEQIAFLQKGLNAHGGSRKGRTFEMYRALVLGIGWDDSGVGLAYDRSFKQGVAPQSKIAGLKAGPGERANLKMLDREDKKQIHTDLPEDKSPRQSDGTVEVTNPAEFEGDPAGWPPAKGRYLIDEKAGPGALKSHSVRNYLADLAYHEGTFVDNSDNKYLGIIILCDTKEHAKGAAKLVMAERKAVVKVTRKDDLDKIYVAFINKRGKLEFLPTK